MPRRWRTFAERKAPPFVVKRREAGGSQGERLGAFLPPLLGARQEVASKANLERAPKAQCESPKENRSRISTKPLPRTQQRESPATQLIRKSALPSFCLRKWWKILPCFCIIYPKRGNNPMQNFSVCVKRRNLRFS
jgi:hypothetical protein